MNHLFSTERRFAILPAAAARVLSYIDSSVIYTIKQQKGSKKYYRGLQDAGFTIQDTGYWMLDSGY